MTHPAFVPGRLGPLQLRNRIIKTATFEGMVVDGLPARTLLRHHREIAAGGVAMTTVAYCAVSGDGRTFDKQMFMRPAAVAPLRRLTDAVHREGAAASIQLGHCGGFSKNKSMTTRRPLGPSRGFNAYGVASGMPIAGAMTETDMHAVVREFADAAAGAREAGFDAVELHLGHGYLLSQFISPRINKRTDEFGGDIANRMRFPRMVVRAVRERLGPGFPILAKINLTDGIRRGLELDDAIAGARLLQTDGITALVTSGGLVARTPFFLLRGGVPLKQMIQVEPSRLQKVALACFGRLLPSHPYEPTFFLQDALQLRAAVSIPIVLLGGVATLADLTRAMDEGFEFVAMGRALLADPLLPNRMRDGLATQSACSPCNECITEMDRPGGVCCAKQADQLERRAREVADGDHLRVC